MAKKTRKARAARVNYDERRSAHDGDETNSDEKTPANFAETAVFAISLSFWAKPSAIWPPRLAHFSGKKLTAITFHFQPLDRALWARCWGGGSKNSKKTHFLLFFEFFEPWARCFSLKQLCFATIPPPNIVLKWQNRQGSFGGRCVPVGGWGQQKTAKNSKKQQRTAKNEISKKYSLPKIT